MAPWGWGRRGGILTLLLLLKEHPAELAYDWRTRFGLPVTAWLTGDQTYAEAYLLARGLLTDPTSRTATAVAGWTHPWSREAFILADLYDFTRMANTNPKHRHRVQPYPRPNRRRPAGQRSAAPTAHPAAVRAALVARGW